MNKESLPQADPFLIREEYLVLLEAQKQEIRQLLSLLEQKDPIISNLERFIKQKEIETSELNRKVKKISAELEKALATFAQQKISFTKQESDLRSQIAQQQVYYHNDLIYWQELLRRTVTELDNQHYRKVNQIIDRLFNRSDYSGALSAPYLQIKDDSIIFGQNLRGYHLQASSNFQRLDYLSYQVSFLRPNLCGVIVAPIIMANISTGHLGIEIVSPQNQIVVVATCPAEEIHGDKPVEIKFPELIGTGQGKFTIRVFARGLNAPLRIYEWRRYTWGGLAPLHRKAFMGYLFS